MDSVQLESLKIFAKKGTDEKAAVLCSQDDAKEVQKILNRKYGGSWVWVDKLNGNEILMYSDNIEYEGYHGREERYSNIYPLS